MKTTYKTIIRSMLSLALVAGAFRGGGTSIVRAQQGLQLSQTRVSICNDTTENRGVKLIRFEDLELTKELCIEVTNNNTEAIRMDLDLVDGAINEHGNIACYNRNHSETIGQFAKKKSYQYTVPPETTEQFLLPLSRELGTIGQFFGCAHYYLKNPDSEGMFQANIGSTKKFIIDIAGELVSEVTLVNPDNMTENQLFIQKKINRLKAILKIINEGNVGQKATYSGSIDWMIGEPQSFNGSFFIQGGEETDIVEQLQIPRYAIFGKLSMTIKFDPESTLGYFDGHFSPPELEQNEFTIETNITNYLLILIILGVITLEIVYLSHKKAKRHKTFASGNQPTMKKGILRSLRGKLKQRRQRKLSILEHKEIPEQKTTPPAENPSPKAAPSTPPPANNQQGYYTQADSCSECQRPYYEENKSPPQGYMQRDYQNMSSNYNQPQVPQQIHPMQGYDRPPQRNEGYSAGPGPIAQSQQPQRRMFHHPDQYGGSYGQDHRGMRQPLQQRSYRAPQSPYPPHEGQHGQYYRGPEGYC